MLHVLVVNIYFTMPINGLFHKSRKDGTTKLATLVKRNLAWYSR